MNILKKICDAKEKNLVEKKKINNIDFFLNKEISETNSTEFLNTLKVESKNQFNLVAEIKRKSPSAGEICKNFEPVKIANIYQMAGAKCLSVLTEESFFGGNINFINKIKGVVKIPILRKDFIIDEWQIYESYYNNADCILLILAILDDTKAKSFLRIAKDLKIDVIIEVHDLDEVKRALKLNPDCIGINNRNLKTLKISLETFKELSKNIPKNIIKICESGLSQNNQLKEMTKYNADAFLIGEFLMKQKNILESTKNLIKK